MQKHTILAVLAILILLGAGWFVMEKRDGEKTIPAVPEGATEVTTTVSEYSTA